MSTVGKSLKNPYWPRRAVIGICTWRLHSQLRILREWAARGNTFTLLIVVNIADHNYDCAVDPSAYLKVITTNDEMMATFEKVLFKNASLQLADQNSIEITHVLITSRSILSAWPLTTCIRTSTFLKSFNYKFLFASFAWENRWL